MKTSLKPVLSVKNGVKAIDFYCKAFGAIELMRVTDPDGNVVAELHIDGAPFFLADESPEHGNISPESQKGISVRIELSVNHPDEVFEKAIAAGARSVYPVADQSYGYRLGRLVDPFGHHWEISKPLHQ